MYDFRFYQACMGGANTTSFLVGMGGARRGGTFVFQVVFGVESGPFTSFHSDSRLSIQVFLSSSGTGSRSKEFPSS